MARSDNPPNNGFLAMYMHGKDFTNIFEFIFLSRFSVPLILTPLSVVQKINDTNTASVSMMPKMDDANDTQRPLVPKMDGVQPESLSQYTFQPSKGFSRDSCKMGHVVKFCNANQVKPLIYGCFNTKLYLTPTVETFPKKLIYGQA